MAETFSTPMLVLLGHELCGHFARSVNDPLLGDVQDGLPAATSVAQLDAYLGEFRSVRGLAKARHALRFICDHAISAPEAVLATMYALPPSESGYGMGPITLNDCVKLDDSGKWKAKRTRYPDLMFSFAPVGINYDGEGHLDPLGLVSVAQAASLADLESKDDAQRVLQDKLVSVRAKAVDDNVRNRQLAAQGRIVFPATKEDLYVWGNLDRLTWQLLGCAQRIFGADTRAYEIILENTDSSRDRQALLDSMLPNGGHGGDSYGMM